MIISPILLGLSLVIFAITTVLDKLACRWRVLPHFVKQYVCGTLGVCSVSDYHNTPPSKFCPFGSGEVYYLRKIKDTLAFSNTEGSNFSGQVNWHKNKPYPTLSGLMFYNDVEEVHDMLVPFASEKFFDFYYQKGFFARPQDLEEFVRRKKEQNCRLDRRLRFVEWYNKHDEEIGVVFILSIIASICMLAVVGGIALHMSDQANRREKVELYFNQAGGVQTIASTNGDLKDGLVYHESINDELVRGHVSKVLEIGGGNTRTCLTRKDKSLICGSAPLGFKNNEEVYVRSGRLMRWLDPGANVFHSRHTDDNWLITRAEAEALVATGKFKIVD